MKGEISNYELRVQGFESDARALIEKELRADQKAQKGHKHLNEATADWMLNKFPYTAQEKKQAVGHHKTNQDKADEQAREAFAKRMAPKLATLEKLHFEEGMKAAREQHIREQKIEAFRQRTLKKLLDQKQGIDRLKVEMEKTRQALELQKKTLATAQNNNPYAADRAASMLPTFKAKVEQQKTLAMEFGKQNEQTTNEVAYAEKMKKEAEQQRRMDRAVAAKKTQAQRGQAIIAKQTPISEQANSKPVKAGTDFSDAASSTNEAPTTLDKQAQIDAFKAKVKAHDQKRQQSLTQEFRQT